MTDKPRNPMWSALGLAWEFGYMIALPLVLFALGGRWLDRHFATSPWFLLGGMGLAILLTTVMMVRKFSSMIDSSEKTKPPAA